MAKIEGLDRAEIRASVIDRFSAGRMTDGYEAIYRAMVEGTDAPAGDGQVGDDDADAPRRLKPMGPGRTAEVRAS